MDYKAFYETVGAENGWDFSKVKRKTEGQGWDFVQEVLNRCHHKDFLLDIGTGGGELVLKYAPAVLMLIGIDYAEGMIKTARKNLAESGQSNARFFPMDAAKLDFPEGFFNIITCRQAPFHAGEGRRVLADGGVFLTQQVSEEDKLNLKQAFGRGQNFGVADGTEKQANLDALRKAGFVEIVSYDYNLRDYYQTPEDLIFLLKHTPIIPDFGRETGDFEVLERFIAENQSDQGIETNEKRYMIIAHK